MECLTCNKSTPVTLFVNNQRDPTATLSSTNSTDAPEWMLERGEFSSLPAYFSCDSRYKKSKPRAGRHHLVPIRHIFTQRVAVEVVLDLPVSVTHVAWWAALPPKKKNQGPSNAYSHYENRGISRVNHGRVHMNVLPPSSYTVDGKPYRPHIHFTPYDTNLGRWDHSKVYTISSSLMGDVKFKIPLLLVAVAVPLLMW